MMGEAPSSGIGSSVWEHLCPLPAWLCQCSAITLGHIAPLCLPQLVFCIGPVLSPLPALPGSEKSKHQLPAPAADWRFLLPIIQHAGSRD